MMPPHICVCIYVFMYINMYIHIHICMVENKILFICLKIKFPEFSMETSHNNFNIEFNVKFGITGLLTHY